MVVYIKVSVFGAVICIEIKSNRMISHKVELVLTVSTGSTRLQI